MAWVDYDQHARMRPREDLWGQVRRTVRGQPVSPEQIDMIVATIVRQLELAPDDRLLDLACGNGALSARLQTYCGSSLGVDLSEYLVGVAQDQFATVRHGFSVHDAADYAEAEPEPLRFSKVLCYGSLSYLDDAAVARLLQALETRFRAVTRVLLGNLPDPARAEAFYPPGAAPDLREPRSDIGVWRGADELARLAGPGWRVITSTMPATFFASHYRFDALLVRAP